MVQRDVALSFWVEGQFKGVLDHEQKQMIRTASHLSMLCLWMVVTGCSIVPEQSATERSLLRLTRQVESGEDDSTGSEQEGEGSPTLAVPPLPVLEQVAVERTEGEPVAIELATGELATGELATGELATGELATGELTIGELVEREQVVAEPTTETAESIPAPPGEPSATVQLQDVIDSVYASYPLLESAFLSRSVASGELLAANGEFDLKLKAGGTSGPLGFYNTHRFGGGVSQPLFAGGEVFGGYRIGRGSFQPWYQERQTNGGGEFNAGVAIPLAQDRRTDARRTELFLATYRREAVEPGIQSQIIAFVWEASYAHWDWVAAGQNLQIANSLLEIAQQRNDGLVKRVNAGDLPDIEVTDNQRLIVSRQASLVDARQKLEQSAIKLSLFLRTPEGQPIIPPNELLPETFPEVASIDIEQMPGDISRALFNRPELAQLALTRKQLRADLAQARNLYRPEVDAVLYASQDVGEPTSPKRDKSPFELEAALQFSVPLQRRKALGEIRSIRGKLAQLSVKIGFTQDKIATDIQKVYTALQASFERIARAQESLELARTMERAERRKFDLGVSNLLLVNLREKATADAAKTVLQAKLDYFQAQADYRAVMAQDVNSESTP